MESDLRIAELARRQHGLIERRQALAAGTTDATLSRRLAEGRLERLLPTVYRVAGAPPSREQRLLAACLAAGDEAAVSHRAAACSWGLVSGHANVVEIVTPRARWPRLSGVTVHRSYDLRADHITIRNGVPITKPLRTLVDLGQVLPAPAISDALERGLISRLFGVAAADAVLDDLGRKGRTGVGVLRSILDARALGRGIPDGLLEPRMARLMRRHGLPQPAFQHVVRANGRFVARVDFAYPGRRIAIEVDGHEVHGTPEAMAADLERQNRLVLEGWTVLRFTWRQVVHQPDRVATAIAAVLVTSASDVRTPA